MKRDYPSDPKPYRNVYVGCTGCQNKKLLPLIEGAPNFRQVLGCLLSTWVLGPCNAASHVICCRCLSCLSMVWQYQLYLACAWSWMCLELHKVTLCCSSLRPLPSAGRGGYNCLLRHSVQGRCRLCDRNSSPLTDVIADAICCCHCTLPLSFALSSCEEGAIAFLGTMCRAV